MQREVSLKKSVVKNDVQSVKHKSSKGHLKEKEKHDSDIADALQRYSKQVHPKGESLSDNTCISHQSGSGVLKSWYSTTNNRRLPWTIRRIGFHPI